MASYQEGKRRGSDDYRDGYIMGKLMQAEKGQFCEMKVDKMPPAPVRRALVGDALRLKADVF